MFGKKILVIGAKEEAHTPTRVREELRKKKISFDFVKWNQLVFVDDKVYKEGERLKLKKYSAIFFNSPACGMIVRYPNKRAQKYSLRLSNEALVLAQRAKELGVKIINLDFSLEYPFYNKFVQGVIFGKKNVSAIETVHFTKNSPEDVKTVLKKRGITFPLIAKESNGGMGKKVWKFDDYGELKDFLDRKRATNFIFQPYVKNDCDYRVLVIGGRSMGIMKRQARKGAWKNNFARGGKVTSHEDKKMERFAEDACAKIGLEYAGVDVLQVGKKYMVIEINLYALFEGFETVFPEINVAEKIVELLIKK